MLGQVVLYLAELYTIVAALEFLYYIIRHAFIDGYTLTAFDLQYVIILCLGWPLIMLCDFIVMIEREVKRLKTANCQNMIVPDNDVYYDE